MPQRVAERAVRDAEAERFMEAMEPAEQRELTTHFAEKLADGIIEDMQGMVDAFNGIRQNLNERRLKRGDEALPLVDLDAGRIRGMLEEGMEASLTITLRVAVETALESLFGQPSHLPQADAFSNPLGPLPALVHPDVDGLNLRLSGTF